MVVVVLLALVLVLFLLVTLVLCLALLLLVPRRPSLQVDVPITFRDRVAGESKLSMKQNVLYLRQLAGLYFFKVALCALPSPLAAPL